MKKKRKTKRKQVAAGVYTNKRGELIVNPGEALAARGAKDTKKTRRGLLAQVTDTLGTSAAATAAAP